MPHVEIQYSRNVGPIDEERLLAVVLEAVAGVGAYERATIKGRVVGLARFAVNSPDDRSGFIATTIRVLDGRDEATLYATSQAVTDAIASEIPTSERMQISTEVVEIRSATYTTRISPPPNKHDWSVTSDEAAVFVHGLFGPFNDATAFRQLDQVECSAPDLDGYGQFVGRRVTLEGQVRALREHIQARHAGSRVHLVAHSIGAVYAFTLADQSPELVGSVTTVEGNFSLADAFWSRSIAALDQVHAQTEIERRLRDPEALLASDGIPSTPENLAKAEEALDYQPWQTVWESASAIVETTAKVEYQAMLRRVFDSCPVHLIAGERSADGWKVPEWARRAATSSTVIPGTGHMMMLEQPETFGASISRLLHAGSSTASRSC